MDAFGHYAKKRLTSLGRDRVAAVQAVNKGVEKFGSPLTCAALALAHIELTLSPEERQRVLPDLEIMWEALRRVEREKGG